MDLRKVDLTSRDAKTQLKVLASASGCQYVCIDTHKRKPCVISARVVIGKALLK